jgi:hypothetical protein
VFRRVATALSCSVVIVIVLLSFVGCVVVMS